MFPHLASLYRGGREWDLLRIGISAVLGQALGMRTFTSAYLNDKAVLQSPSRFFPDHSQKIFDLSGLSFEEPITSDWRCICKQE